MNYNDSKDQKNYQKTKFCVYCGKEIPINAKKCSYCFEWLNDEVSSQKIYLEKNSLDVFGENVTSQNSLLKNENYYRNTNISHPLNKKTIEYSKIIPIRRLYLLMILTFGLYSIYWFYKNSCNLRDETGKDISVGLRTLAFAIIPIANLIVFYELLNEMKKLIEEKGLESFSPGLNTLALIFSPIVGIWAYINVQESFNEFWRIQDPHLRVRREFSNGEILAMIFMAIVVPILIVIYIFLLIYLLTFPYYY